MMRHRFLTVCDREIHFTEWGTPVSGRPSVVCWHGLARTCRDYDTLAGALAQRGFHVICPDTIGRGLSQWSPEPAAEYQVFFYIKLAEGLLSSLGISHLYWFGTSMGGMIGYMAAATALRSHIQRLVLNDVGPTLSEAAIQRIVSYASVPPVMATFSQLEAFMENAYRCFGIHDPELMRSLVLAGSRRTAAGEWTVHYDPRVVDALKVGEYTGLDGFSQSWELYDSITCPTLTLRGATSDLFSAETLEEMTRRGPKCKAVVIEDVGHAPAMNTEAQIQHVLDFFE